MNQGEHAELSRRFAELHPALTVAEALSEANRCLYCFDAPCAQACPTHIDVASFIKKISTGNLRGSAATILEANVLGLSCSRVCPVDVLCEGACVLHRQQMRPIEIGRLQRHAMDYFYSHDPALPVGEPKPGKIACIGSGPASMACAAELRRYGHRVTIFDKRELPGGLNTYGVAEYKFTASESLRETDLVRDAGVDFRQNADVGTDLSIEWIEAQFDAVFIGVGLGPTNSLGVPGERLKGVVDALHFISEYKQGRPHTGRRVVVIGGGNTAIDAAIASCRLGAEEVRMLYRRGEKEMPAFAFEFAHARQEGVLFDFFTLPVAIHGEGAVSSIECVRMELGAAEMGDRTVARAVPGSNFVIECDMVVTSIGQTKLVDLLAQYRGLQLDGGRVVVDPDTGQTTNPRYFAGGDCVNGGREVVDAVAGGKRAATGIVAWLERYG